MEIVAGDDDLLMIGLGEQRPRYSGQDGLSAGAAPDSGALETLRDQRFTGGTTSRNGQMTGLGVGVA